MANSKQNEEVIQTLIRLADSLDHEDKLELAEEVDKTLESFAARPRAPLKSLDDDVKKKLTKFLYDAEKNLSDSVNGLEEFFRRLRYYGVDNIIRELGLDKISTGMKEVHTDVAESVKKFYEITHGRKPGKKDIGELIGEKEEATPPQAAEDFFEDKNKSESVEDDSKLDMCSKCGVKLGEGTCQVCQHEAAGGGIAGLRESPESAPEEEISEEELKNFWDDFNKIK